MIDDEVWNYTWEHGRQLASMTTATGSATWSYTYDSNGLRTSRTGGNLTYQYIYEGDKLVMLKRGNTVMRFVYDAQGRPMMMDYNGTPYYYIRNAQGDVMALADANGVRVVRYTYDAWGNPISAIGMKVDTVGKHNPLRYRGYVYDWETKLYYLQSRYYNPQVGRFINADAFVSTGQGILGNNMFAYCRNNSVRRVDVSGELDEECFDEDGNPFNDLGGPTGGGSGGGSVGTGAVGSSGGRVSGSGNGSSGVGGTSTANISGTGLAPKRGIPGSKYTQFSSDGNNSIVSQTTYNEYGMPGYRADYEGRSHHGIATPHMHIFSYTIIDGNVYRCGEQVVAICI